MRLRYFNKLSLRMTLTIPFILLIITTVGLVGYLSFRSGESAVDDLAHQLISSTADRIGQKTISYLDKPYLINRSNVVAWYNGELTTDDFDTLNQQATKMEKSFFNQASADIDTPTIYFANRQGDFVMVKAYSGSGGPTERYIDEGAGHINIQNALTEGKVVRYVLDEKGNRTIWKQSGEYDVTKRPWYQIAVQAEGFAWSPIYEGAAGGILFLTAVYPVNDESGNFYGVFSCDLTLEQITAFLRNMVITPNGEAFIIERSGELVATSMMEDPLTRISDKEVERLRAIDSSEPLIQTSTKHILDSFGDFNQITKLEQFEYKLDNNRYIAQIKPFTDGRGLDWLIVVTVPASDFMGQVYDNIFATLLLAVLALVAAVAIGILTVRWVVRPILNLNKAAEELAEGNWDQSISVDRQDEVGMLTTSFNSMARQLKESFETLEQSEKNYSAVVQQARDGIVIAQDGVIVFVNNALLEISGFSEDDLLGKGFLYLIEPANRAIIDQRYKDRLEGKEVPATYETRFNCKDGTIKDVEASTGIILYQGRQATLAIIRDITERKQAEEEITKFKTIADNATYGVTITDINGNIIYLNKAHAEMQGYTIGELIGKHYSVLYTKDQVKKVLATREKLFAEGNHSGESWRKRKDGTIFSTLTTRILVKDASGQPHYIATTHFDLTERKKVEQELVELNKQLKQFSLGLEQKVKERTSELEIAIAEAESANQAKSEFLASMSHELRTPLNAIIGFSQILYHEDYSNLEEAERGYAKDIYESGSHLLSLINDILDLAKVESGKMELELEPVKIKHLLEASMVMIKEKAFNHGIELATDIASEFDDFEIMADERKLKQIAFNLLSNAAKFTPDGGKITVACKKEGEQLVVSVTDTGFGISAEETERVFEEFYQTKDSSKSKAPGTGLGLPLTRSFVEMHGGKIWVDSEGKDKGSRFTFTIPIR